MGSVAWVVLIQDDLYPYLVGAQVNALRTAALSTSSPVQGDPFLAVYPDVAKEVRTAIASNPMNRLSATANSVPPELKRVTVWLTLEAMQGRLTGLNFSDHQKDQIKDAKDKLEKIRLWTSKLWWAISEPSDPETDPSQEIGPSASIVNSETRLLTRESLHRL